ncbi:hypothetical protein GQR58_025984 [Nymphon striatum]|nr:hypothetical protein GQR58_025984 [Nymphon striatum]
MVFDMPDLVIEGKAVTFDERIHHIKNVVNNANIDWLLAVKQWKRIGLTALIMETEVATLTMDRGNLDGTTAANSYGNTTANTGTNGSSYNMPWNNSNAVMVSQCHGTNNGGNGFTMPWNNNNGNGFTMPWNNNNNGFRMPWQTNSNYYYPPQASGYKFAPVPAATTK